MDDKVCSKCGKAKPATLDYFARNKLGPDGLQIWCKRCQKAYRDERREENIQYLREHYQKNKAKYKEYRAKNADRIRAYREAHKERDAERYRRYRLANLEREAKRLREWQANNRDKVAAANHRRRARKLQASGTHTAEDIKTQHDRQKGRCYYCDAAMGDAYEVDHIIPLSRGGNDGPENIVIACTSCNRSKGSSLPHEWPQGNRLL